VRGDINFRGGLIFIIIIVIIKVEVFADGPVTKFIKQELASFIPINFFPGFLWICHIDTPLLKLRFSHFKLFKGNPSIIVGVYTLKSHPILVVLSEKFEKDTELTYTDVVICI